jgi:hypothetical protein
MSDPNEDLTARELGVLARMGIVQITYRVPCPNGAHVLYERRVTQDESRKVAEELSDLSYWRERHARESFAAASHCQELWRRLQSALRRIEELEASTTSKAGGQA